MFEDALKDSYQEKLVESLIGLVSLYQKVGVGKKQGRGQMISFYEPVTIEDELTFVYQNVFSLVKKTVSTY
jgi:hypothetical protein